MKLVPRGALVNAFAMVFLVACGAVPTSADSADFAGTSWRMTGYDNGRQAMTSTLAGTVVTMVFSADGRVSGSAGCNRYGAAYEVKGTGLRFGAAFATKMMCVTPDGVMDQERHFLQALATVASARVEGDRLELRAADGTPAITLVKEVAR
jgi:heat shock protein HslJ